MKKISIALLTLGLVLTGCSSKEAPTESSDDTVTIKHELGEAVVPLNPQRIVVFDLGVLETLDELEIDVIGVPKEDLSKSTEKYKGDKYENVGTLFEPNFEKLFELKPDLIIISGRTSDHYDELTKIAPTVYLWPDNSKFLESTFNIWKTIGQIYPDKASYVDDKIKQVMSDKDQLAEKASATDLKALVLMVSGSDLSVFSSGSRYGMVYDDFGFAQADTKVADSNHGDNISFEYLVDVNPDIIFVLDRGQIVGADVLASDFLNNDLVNSTTAAKNKQIIYLDTEAWYLSTTSMRSVEKMIIEVAAALK